MAYVRERAEHLARVYTLINNGDRREKPFKEETFGFVMKYAFCVLGGIDTDMEQWYYDNNPKPVEDYLTGKDNLFAQFIEGVAEEIPDEALDMEEYQEEVELILNKGPKQ